MTPSPSLFNFTLLSLASGVSFPSSDYSSAIVFYRCFISSLDATNSARDPTPTLYFLDLGGFIDYPIELGAFSLPRDDWIDVKVDN